MKEEIVIGCCVAGPLVFIFSMLLFSSYIESVQKQDCIKFMRDKPAIEILAICRGFK